MPTGLPRESELLNPVLSLFGSEHTAVLEAKLSRKRIDILFVPHGDGQWISVELKVREWKKALWQATVNTQLADISYIALWETCVKAALEQEALFRFYGVGIIAVSTSAAAIVREGTITPNATRVRQQQLLLESMPEMNQKGESLVTPSLLSA